MADLLLLERILELTDLMLHALEAEDDDVFQSALDERESHLNQIDFGNLKLTQGQKKDYLAQFEQQNQACMTLLELLMAKTDNLRVLNQQEISKLTLQNQVIRKYQGYPSEPKGFQFDDSK